MSQDSLSYGIFPPHLQLKFAWAMSRFLASTSVTAGTLSHDAWRGFYGGVGQKKHRLAVSTDLVFLLNKNGCLNEHDDPL